MTTIIISGVTCAGKSTLIEALAEAGIKRIVTVTTRQARNGEINGRHYNFVAVNDFNAIEQSGGFAETNQFSGNKYGTLVEDLKAPGIKAVVVDPNGHRNIKKVLKKLGLPYLSVFLDADEGKQSTRFMERVRKELEFARHSGRFVAPVLQTNATRMGSMLTTEQHWRDVARCKETPYDLVIESLDPDTQEAVLAEIVTRAQSA